MVIDYPYIFFIVILLCLVWCENYYGNKRLLFNLSCLATFVFVAFRAPTVGADTWNYCYYYLNEKGYYLNRAEVESLFYLYAKITRFVFAENVTLFIVSNTVLSFLPIYYIIKKHSASPCLSVALFFLLFQYNIYFVALRQVLAMSLGLCSIMYFYERRRWRWCVFFILTLVAYNMHRATIIIQISYLLVYFLPIKNKKIVFVIIFVSLLSGIILQIFEVQKFLDLMIAYDISPTERLENYLDMDLRETASMGPTVLLPSIVAVFVYYYLNNKQINSLPSKLYLLSVVIMNLFYQVQMITRMNAGFSIFSIIVFTWIITDTLKTKRFFRQALSVILLTLTLLYVREKINYDKSGPARMHPYYFFFEDYATIDWPKLRKY